MERRVKLQAGASPPAPEVQQTVLDAWRSVLDVDGDTRRGQYTRSQRLQVPDSAKKAVLDSCEHWAALLFRVAHTQWIVHMDVFDEVLPVS